LEGSNSGSPAEGQAGMTTAAEARSGKTHRDENFPVASWLIAKSRRGPILAFYRFVRTADDVADNPSLSSDEKIALLDGLGEALCGGRSDPDAEPLRLALREHGLPPRHALDLLDAFRLDARKTRYASWRELMDYCRLSAMPVGRFVLDIHSEDRALWPASDALCAALQVINHLQDCGEDYRLLDRVYLPEAILKDHKASVEMLGANRGSPALLEAIAALAHRTEELVDEGAALIPQIADARLALEIAAIHALARQLVRRLQHRDPLSQSVHLSKSESAWVAGLAGLRSVASVLLHFSGRRARARA
jgi:hydroxysqualene synthase